jgi:hypothetical protein
MTTALTEPSVFVRVVASLMPKELEATITVVHADRMSDDELAALGLMSRRRCSNAPTIDR